MNKCLTTLFIVVASLAIGFFIGTYFRPILDLNLVEEFYSKFTTIFVKTLVAVLTVLLSGIVGYAFGSVKTFREEKQKAYSEILPPIVRMAYEPTPDDQKEFNKALSKLWLYSSREVAFKVDKVVSILVDPTRGEITKAIQEAVVVMRNDIYHKWPFAKIKPEEVKHLYMRIGAR